MDFSNDEIIKIKTFKDSYNALYIKDFTLEKKQAVRDTVNNPVLERLIDNLEAPKNYMVDFIEGPISMTKLKLMNQRKSFYIFGEKHIDDIQDHCSPMVPKVISVNFVEYIKRLSTNSPSFFDVYIELPMLRLSKPENRNNPAHYDLRGASTSRTIYTVFNKMILDESLNFEHEFNIEKYTGEQYRLKSEILNTFPIVFKNCIQPSTRNSTECNLMRIHNIDIRTSMNSEEMNSDFYIEVLDGLFMMTNINIFDKIKLLKRLDLNKIMEALGILLSNGRITIENMLAIPFTNNSLIKEINKISLELKEKIINFARGKYHEILILPLFKNIETQILRLISILSNEDYNNDLTERDVLILRRFFREINVVMVDMYCLSRIFKKHTKIYDYQSPFQPEESRNIIIYAGNVHSTNYVNFLKSAIGAVETYSIHNPLKSCIRTRSSLPEIDSLLIRTYSNNLNKRRDATQKKNEQKITEESFEAFFEKMVLIEKRTIQLFESTRDSNMTVPEYKRNINIMENLINIEYQNLIKFL